MPLPATVLTPAACPAGPVGAPHPPVGLPALAARTAALLRARVPLTLLLDLGADDGPRSRQRYAAEPADDGWLAALR